MNQPVFACYQKKKARQKNSHRSSLQVTDEEEELPELTILRMDGWMAPLPVIYVEL